MAQGVFTFRITSEGVEELKRNLEQLGPTGTKAFEQLRQMSPQLKTAFEAAGKSVDQARAKIEQMPGTVGRLSASFEAAESGVKKAGRSFNDVVGTFQLLGGVTGSAGQNLSALATTIGNVSDVFGTLGTLLGKHPLLIIGSVVSLAATAFISFRDKSAEAAKAQEDLQKALEKTNELLLTQAQRAEIALEAARKAATGATDTALPDVAKQAAEAERNVRRLEAAADRQQAAAAKFAGRQFDTPAGQQAKAAAESARAALESERVKLNQLLIQRDTLTDPTKFAQRELLFPGRGSLQFRTGGSREDLSEEEARAQLAKDAEARNAITGQAIERNNAKLEEQRRAAEAAMKAWEAFEERQAQLIEATVNANQKRNESVSKYIGKLEEEAKLSGQTNEEREIGRALYEAQLKLVDDLGNKMRDLTDAEKERIAVAVKTRNAIEEQTRAAERLQQEMERAAKRSADRLVDFAGDALFDRLTGKVTNFWDTFRDYGLRVISQMAAEAVIRPIVQPLVMGAAASAPGLFGVQSASAGTLQGQSSGGIGSLISSPFSSLLSTGGSLISSAFGGSGGLLQGIGGLVGGALGLGTSATTAAAAAPIFASAAIEAGAATAASAGSLAASAGGVAAAGLSPLAATGIGALIAIPALFALSGLFGKKKNVGPFASYAAVLGADGSLTYKGGGEKNGGSMAQMQEATQSFAQAIKQAANVLGIYKLPALDIGVGSNKQYGTFFGTAGSERGAVYFGQDPGVAAAAYLRRSFQGTLTDYGQTVAPTTEAARIFARTTGDVQSDLEFVAVYESLDEAASAAGKVSRTLDELNSKFDDYADKARQYGLEVDRIETARQKAIEDAVASLMQPVGSRLSSITGLVASLTIGAASPLSAEQQLAAARDQFETLSASARDGDASAQSALGDAGRAYLDVARGFYATSEPYASIFGTVIDQIGDVVKSVRDTDPVVRAIVETGEKGNAAVTKLLGQLIDSVDALKSEVRRSNDIPLRLTS